MKNLILCLMSLLILAACEDPTMEQVTIQGHRGCRGLLPENSIPAFLKAVDLGVSTLEMDVVISADHQVVVSHEPFFNPEICTHPDGSPISEGEAEALMIYGMRLDSVQLYPCGHIPHPRFPDQESIEYRKPSLKECLSEVLEYCKTKNKAIPELNIEAKSVEELYGKLQPEPQVFAELLLDELAEINWPAKLSLQSFDMNMLKALRERSIENRLVCLNEDEAKSLDELINMLGFTPEVYSPDFQLVDRELVEKCDEMGITLSVWTVNEAEDISRMLDLEIRDIITDFPDRAIEICKEKGFEVRH